MFDILIIVLLNTQFKKPPKQTWDLCHLVLEAQFWIFICSLINVISYWFDHSLKKKKKNTDLSSVLQILRLYQLLCSLKKRLCSSSIHIGKQYKKGAYWLSSEICLLNFVLFVPGVCLPLFSLSAPKLSAVCGLALYWLF